MLDWNEVVWSVNMQIIMNIALKYNSSLYLVLRTKMGLTVPF